MDLLMIAVIIVIAAATLGLVKVCRRLEGYNDGR